MNTPERTALDLPKTLNGYPVLKAEDHGNGCATVLVQKDDGERVVATWWPSLGRSWSWGHYFPIGLEDAAARDFTDTARRNAGR